MMLAKLRLPTSRTLLNLKMMHAKLPLPILTTLPSPKMMAAKLTLLLLMPEPMLKLQPEMERTRLLMRESAKRSPTAKQPLQNSKQEVTHRMKMMQENKFLKSLAGKTLGVYFNAYRTKAYDGGGLDTDTGIFTCPTGGTYMFQFHIATHDNKKA